MAENEEPLTSRAEELKAAFIVVGIIIPALTIFFIGSYGFVVWMMQLIFGPPTV